jgi:hypothetical protein
MLQNFYEMPNLFWIKYYNKKWGDVCAFDRIPFLYKKVSLSRSVTKQHAMMTVGGQEELLHTQF